MSRASKLTLLGSSLFAATTIAMVHFQQKFEKDKASTLHPSSRSYSARESIIFANSHFSHEQAMHEGVVRDMEQQRVKRERQLDFDMQRALEEEYKKGQTVRDSTGEMDSSSGGGGGAAAR